MTFFPLYEKKHSSRLKTKNIVRSLHYLAFHPKHLWTRERYYRVIWYTLHKSFYLITILLQQQQQITLDFLEMQFIQIAFQFTIKYHLVIPYPCLYPAPNRSTGISHYARPKAVIYHRIVWIHFQLNDNGFTLVMLTPRAKHIMFNRHSSFKNLHFLLKLNGHLLRASTGHLPTGLLLMLLLMHPYIHAYYIHA